MTDERTSLFAESRPGPSYAFPGRPPRSQHQRKVKQFQCCICISFITVLAITLIIAIIYSITSTDTTDGDNPDNEPRYRRRRPDGWQPLQLQQVLNESDILNLMVLASWPMSDEQADVWTLPQPTERQLREAIYAGTKALGDKELLEENTASPAVNTPSFRHQRAVSTTFAARVMAKRGYVENEATMHYMREHKLSKPPHRWTIGRGPALPLAAPSNATRCDSAARFRNANGTCNNRREPLRYGVAMQPFRRALQPDYADGVAAPRRTHRNNGTLPSARLVSLGVHRPSYSSDPKFTVMLAVFGQFLDHDITATALNQAQDGKPIDCCAGDEDEENGEAVHPECFAVRSGRGDPNYDRYNISCMNFVRSAPAPTGHFGPRQQLNQATAFIDGSVVYGVLDERVQRLRSNEHGLLRMFHTPDNRTLLPVSTDPLDGCNEAQQNARGRYCFESGDTRGNENLHLTAMHLLWARHHNYLAAGMREVNPQWDDERLFQEARRLLAAQLQHITFNEFLVTLLGDEYTREVGIQSAPEGDVENESKDTYDESVDASIANVFAACAFRFAHTLIPGLMNMTKDPTTPEYIELHRMLFNPYSLWAAGGLDTAIGSAIDTTLAKSDRYFTRELTEKLFENPMPANRWETQQQRSQQQFAGDGSTNGTSETLATTTQRPTTTSTTPTTTAAPSPTTRRTVGLDLVSLNIQRGRDHGLPAYTEWRQLCRLPSADTWEEMAGAVDTESLRSMRAIFKDAVDVDLYTGALSEPPMMGAIIGPLLTCLITDQFMRLKRGDSFWFERTEGPQRFTKAQIRQIHGTTLAAIICRNSDAVSHAQKYVMRQVSADNPIVDCGQVDTFDFGPWRESEPHYVSVYSQSQTVRVRSVPGNSTMKEVPLV